MEPYSQYSIASAGTQIIDLDPKTPFIGLQVCPVTTATYAVYYSMFVTPDATQWNPWMFGTAVTASQIVDVSPAVRQIKIVSTSGALTAAVVRR